MYMLYVVLYVRANIRRYFIFMSGFLSACVQDYMYMYMCTCTHVYVHV